MTTYILKHTQEHQVPFAHRRTGKNKPGSVPDVAPKKWNQYIYSSVLQHKYIKEQLSSLWTQYKYGGDVGRERETATSAVRTGLEESKSRPR